MKSIKSSALFQEYKSFYKFILYGIAFIFLYVYSSIHVFSKENTDNSFLDIIYCEKQILLPDEFDNEEFHNILITSSNDNYYALLNPHMKVDSSQFLVVINIMNSKKIYFKLLYSDWIYGYSIKRQYNGYIDSILCLFV